MPTQWLPLFPLNAVLFPHMALPLHIFEPRYRQMIGDCLEEGHSFGVVAIREGTETGPATPYEVGTLAKIVRIDRLDEGRGGLPRVHGGAGSPHRQQKPDGKRHARSQEWQPNKAQSTGQPG